MNGPLREELSSPIVSRTLRLEVYFEILKLQSGRSQKPLLWLCICSLVKWLSALAGSCSLGIWGLGLVEGEKEDGMEGTKFHPGFPTLEQRLACKPVSRKESCLFGPLPSSWSC